MKKLFILLLLSSIIMLNANSQNYQPFKFGFGLGATLTGTKGYGAEGGMLITLEPAYRISDDLAIGLRLESAATRIYFDFFEAYGYSIVSYSVNGQYYLGDKKFRPFVGAGIGSYRLDGDFFHGTKVESKFGFYPRVGFDLGHFFMALDYNILPPSNTIYLDNITNSYCSIRMGFFVGGGKME